MPENQVWRRRLVYAARTPPSCPRFSAMTRFRQFCFWTRSQECQPTAIEVEHSLANGSLVVDVWSIPGGAS
jgi:hypothetical protein